MLKVKNIFVKSYLKIKYAIFLKVLNLHIKSIRKTLNTPKKQKTK